MGIYSAPRTGTPKFSNQLKKFQMNCNIVSFKRKSEWSFGMSLEHTIPKFYCLVFWFKEPQTVKGKRMGDTSVSLPLVFVPKVQRN